MWLENAVKLFNKKKYRNGDIISHLFLSTALGVNVEKDPTVYAFRISLFKSHLLTEYKIYLKSIYGKGYRITPPDEQVGEAVQELTKSMSTALSKSRRIAENIRLEELSQPDRKRRIDALTKFDLLTKSFEKRNRELKKITPNVEGED